MNCDFEQRRDEMVFAMRDKISLRDQTIFSSFQKVPRHLFVPKSLLSSAYELSALPGDEPPGLWSISEPCCIAAMIDALALEKTDKILDVGSGTGYHAALLAQHCDSVVAIERIGVLVDRARVTCSKLGYANIRFHLGDGSEGWPEEAPYDAINVAFAVPKIPTALLSQLRIGGRMVIPIEEDHGGPLLLITKTGQKTFDESKLFQAFFVPMHKGTTK